MDWITLIQRMSEEDLRVLSEELPPIDLKPLDGLRRHEIAEFAMRQSIATSDATEPYFGKNVARHTRVGFNVAWALTDHFPLSAELINEACEQVNLQSHKHHVSRLADSSLLIVRAALITDVLPRIFEKAYPEQRQAVSRKSAAYQNDPVRTDSLLYHWNKPTGMVM